MQSPQHGHIAVTSFPSPFSSTNAEIPLAPAAGSVTAITV